MQYIELFIKVDPRFRSSLIVHFHLLPYFAFNFYLHFFCFQMNSENVVLFSYLEDHFLIILAWFTRPLSSSNVNFHFLVSSVHCGFICCIFFKITLLHRVHFSPLAITEFAFFLFISLSVYIYIYIYLQVPWTLLLREEVKDSD